MHPTGQMEYKKAADLENGMAYHQQQTMAPHPPTHSLPPPQMQMQQPGNGGYNLVGPPQYGAQPMHPMQHAPMMPMGAAQKPTQFGHQNSKMTQGLDLLVYVAGVVIPGLFPTQPLKFKLGDGFQAGSTVNEEIDHLCLHFCGNDRNIKANFTNAMGTRTYRLFQRFGCFRQCLNIFCCGQAPSAEVHATNAPGQLPYGAAPGAGQDMMIGEVRKPFLCSDIFCCKFRNRVEIVDFAAAGADPRSDMSVRGQQLRQQLAEPGSQPQYEFEGSICQIGYCCYHIGGNCCVPIKHDIVRTSDGRRVAQLTKKCNGIAEWCGGIRQYDLEWDQMHAAQTGGLTEDAKALITSAASYYHQYTWSWRMGFLGCLFDK